MGKIRPAAVPLATVDPYFSVWSMADKLNGDITKHWTGKPNSMTGLIKVDGKSYVYMGKYDSADAAEQKDVDVDALTTQYVFTAGGVRLTIRFTTPLLLDDLDLLSRPVSYVDFDIESLDGDSHDVELYFDSTKELCVNTPDQEITWGRTDTLKTNAAFMGSKEQNVLGKAGDDIRIDWGYFYIVSFKDQGATILLNNVKSRDDFVSGAPVNRTDYSGGSKAAGDKSVIAVYKNFGRIDTKKFNIMLAYDDIYSIEYFHKKLKAYWKRNGLTIDKILDAACEEHDGITAKCEKFNKMLRQKAEKSGGKYYADLVSLGYRQAIAAHKLTADENGDILFFSKECFSNGCIATVDVSYPSIPLFLCFNPELVKGMIEPIFKYADMEEWPFDFAPHDVGCYPLANGQVYGNNELKYQMPVEECGNMLIMTATFCRATKDASFAEKNWQLLSKWVKYLENYGMDPGNQLCTDDFAGHLEHNANLSVKAIIGIACYSILCDMLGHKEDAGKYLSEAKEMALKWKEMANDGDHYRLSYNLPGSWSMKYNMVWDDILGLNLFPDSVKRKEIAFYLKKQNKYGLPLDNRKEYTKSDWLVWVATMSKTKDEFEMLIKPLWDFINETKSRVPFTDWYETVKCTQVGFQHRSVIGGIFIKLLSDKGLK